MTAAMMTGKRSRSQPPNATRQPGVVPVIAPLPIPTPVYPPIALLNQMHANGRIRKRPTFHVVSPSAVKYAPTRYAIAITPETILLFILLSRLFGLVLIAYLSECLFRCVYDIGIVLSSQQFGQWRLRHGVADLAQGSRSPPAHTCGRSLQ